MNSYQNFQNDQNSQEIPFSSIGDFPAYLNFPLADQQDFPEIQTPFIPPPNQELQTPQNESFPANPAFQFSTGQIIPDYPTDQDLPAHSEFPQGQILSAYPEIPQGSAIGVQLSDQFAPQRVSHGLPGNQFTPGHNFYVNSDFRPLLGQAPIRNPEIKTAQGQIIHNNSKADFFQGQISQQFPPPYFQRASNSESTVSTRQEDTDQRKVKRRMPLKLGRPRKQPPNLPNPEEHRQVALREDSSLLRQDLSPPCIKVRMLVVMELPVPQKLQRVIDLLTLFIGGSCTISFMNDEITRVTTPALALAAVCHYQPAFPQGVTVELMMEYVLDTFDAWKNSPEDEQLRLRSNLRSCVRRRADVFENVEVLGNHNFLYPKCGDKYRLRKDHPKILFYHNLDKMLYG